MNASKNRDRLVGDASQLDRVELLLERYPQTNSAEQQEICDFLKKATPLEVGLISCNASIWTKVEQYKTDHPHHFRTSRLAVAAWLALAVAVVLAVAMLWDFGVI